MQRCLIFVCLLSISTALVAQDEVRYQTGLEFIDQEQYKGIPLASPSFSGILPPKKELVPFAPLPEGGQGDQSSCVGWAVAFALKSHQEEIERRWGITEHEFSPAFIYNQIKRASNCRGGSTFPDALNLLRRDGAATLAAFPYDEFRCDQIPSPAVKQGAAEFRVADWRRVNILDETEVKTHLAAGFPVLFGMPVDQEFTNLAPDSVYQRFTGPSLGGHAMVLTGYDDEKGAFRIQNSWDTWSDAGRGWISYPAFRGTALEGYVVQDIIAAAPITSRPPQIEFETIVMAEVPAGTRSATRITGNHHCSFNCEGEPTRTNYSLSVTAHEGARLRNPQLRCVTGPCHGWNSVLFARLEDDNRSAVASWDVWAHPTTWELTAQEVRLNEVSRFTRRENLGAPFTIVSETGAPPPRVSGRFPTGETFSFIAGRPTGNQHLQFLGLEVQGPETLYRYETR